MAHSSNYDFIGDEFNSIDQVQAALRKNGLESSNLIVAIDYTISNETTGKHSFGGKSLHTISKHPNPYEQTIQIIGKSLAAFDEDNLIPCYGFGDETTKDADCFNFYKDGRPCNGLNEVLVRYRQITPHVKLHGPTSFAPVIEAAVRKVEESGGLYHILLIIADGQMSRIDTPKGTLSPQEQATRDAIVYASNYALSIVLVGCGDGPWRDMKLFDDHLGGRNFDNFQFVNFTKMMQASHHIDAKVAEFSTKALMEIPTQFKACIAKGYLGATRGEMRDRVVIPPPPPVLSADEKSTHTFLHNLQDLIWPFKH